MFYERSEALANVLRVAEDIQSRMAQASVILPRVVQGFPHFNVVRKDATHFEATVALAGFRSEDLSIVRHEDRLEISGQPFLELAEGEVFIHQGIANRRFKLDLPLNPEVEVRKASFENGLLRVEFERVIPEHLRAHKITIETAPQAETLLTPAAA